MKEILRILPTTEYVTCLQKSGYRGPVNRYSLFPATENLIRMKGEVTLTRVIKDTIIIYGKSITLIDTGVAGCEKQIFDTIQSRGRDPSEVDLIILTHAHPDHIGAAMKIQKKTGSKIAVHQADKAWIEDIDLQNRERPVPGFSTLVGGPVRGDLELSDGEILVLDETRNMTIQVLHTPGHSPGSVSLFMPDEGLLFSGDAIPVPGDLPVYDDALSSVTSIRRIREHVGIRVLLSAWHKPREGDEAYQQMDKGLLYLQQIHDAVRACSDTESADLMEITRKTAELLGLPPQAVNSLLARTFSANLRIRGTEKLIE